jgi:hypothetical protein
MSWGGEEYPMAYRFINLSDELVLIRWNRVPSKEEGHQFIAEFRALLDKAAHLLYILSDLRQGHISDARTLQELSRLASHKNLGAGTAFASGMADQSLKGIFVGLFVSLSRDKSRVGQIAGSLDEALEYLEEAKPGVTKDIDWEVVLKQTS